jgi:two-component system response regulator GlrR
LGNEQCDILLVDDDPGLLRLLSFRLKAAGYCVKPAESGEAALNLLTLFQPKLIITDLRMEGMDGMSLFHEVRRRRPDIPVIILTAHGTVPDAVKATHAGVFQFLIKPFDSKGLLEQIRNAMRLAGPTAASEGNEGVWRQAIITRSALMEEILGEAKLAACSDANVFINGESGTGKELLAQAIHAASRRHSCPFVALNCSAIPSELLESEMFGHSRGAFTGAVSDRKGLFESANGGTLLLDEIGDMPTHLQSKLLRVLQERQVRPVGSNESIAVDVRIISATHRDVDELLDQNIFRADIYYRLNVVNLTLPPLRQRREDIPLLTNFFLEKLSSKHSRNINAFAPDAMDLLMSADWPGNVRQLQNAVEYCIALSPTSIIPAALVKKAIRDRTNEILSFAEARSRFERRYLVQLLQMTEGNVSHAARLAKRNRTDFYKLLGRYKLNPALFKQDS